MQIDSISSCQPNFNGVSRFHLKDGSKVVLNVFSDSKLNVKGFSCDVFQKGKVLKHFEKKHTNGIPYEDLFNTDVPELSRKLEISDIESIAALDDAFFDAYLDDICPTEEI